MSRLCNETHCTASTNGVLHAFTHSCYKCPSSNYYPVLMETNQHSKGLRCTDVHQLSFSKMHFYQKLPEYLLANLVMTNCRLFMAAFIIPPSHTHKHTSQCCTCTLSFPPMLIYPSAMPPNAYIPLCYAPQCLYTPLLCPPMLIYPSAMPPNAYIPLCYAPQCLYTPLLCPPNAYIPLCYAPQCLYTPLLCPPQCLYTPLLCPPMI